MGTLNVQELQAAGFNTTADKWALNIGIITASEAGLPTDQVSDALPFLIAALDRDDVNGILLSPITYKLSGQLVIPANKKILTIFGKATFKFNTDVTGNPTSVIRLLDNAEITDVIIDGSISERYTAGNFSGAVTAATIAKLGWTKSIIDTTSNMFDKVGNQMRSVWPDVQEKSINATRDIWTITKGMVVGGVEGARTGWNVTGSIDTPGSTEGQILNTGVKASGAVIGATFTMFSVGVASLFYTLFKLLQIVVVGGFRLICSTYNHLLQSTPLSQRYI